MSILLPGLLAAAALVAVGWLWLARRRAPPAVAASPGEASAAAAAAAASAPAPALPDIAFEDADTAALRASLYAVAFGTEDLAAAADAGQVALLRQVRDAVGAAIVDRQYFPRRPMVIPQLLQASRSKDSALKELVEIIAQDPVLTGDVLQLANSAYYRGGGPAVDTLGRAVSLLGTDGLRALVSASVLQPVFRVPKGCFDTFSETIWNQAFKSAIAAQTYARRTRSCDSFTAHLLTLLGAIGWIVLFRLCADKYAQSPALTPQAGVFTALLDEQADRVALAIAENWALSAAMLEALAEHIARKPVGAMSPLAKAMYYGRLCGSCAVLFEHRRPSEPRTLALRKGLDEKDFDAMWAAVLPAAAED